MDIGTAMTLVQTVAGQAAEGAAKTGITGENLVTIGKAIGMGVAIGFGVFGPGVSEGLATGKAVEGIARNPGASGLIMRTMIVGQAITESNSIYALLVALMILFLL